MFTAERSIGRWSENTSIRAFSFAVDLSYCPDVVFKRHEYLEMVVRLAQRLPAGSGSDSDSQADRRPGTPPMSGTGPGPWAEHYAFPHRFPVGATVWVGQHGPLAGTAHHPRTQVRITSRGWAWGNPCYDLEMPDGTPFADDISEAALQQN